MDEEDKFPPKGILSFVLGDGSPWAGPMRVLGLQDEPQEDDLSPEMRAHLIIPSPEDERLH